MGRVLPLLHMGRTAPASVMGTWMGGSGTVRATSVPHRPLVISQGPLQWSRIREAARLPQSARVCCSKQANPILAPKSDDHECTPQWPAVPWRETFGPPGVMSQGRAAWGPVFPEGRHPAIPSVLWSTPRTFQLSPSRLAELNPH